MENIAIANALTATTATAGGGVDLAALGAAGLGDAAQQFDLLLSGQLQMLLTQGAVVPDAAGVAVDVDFPGKSLQPDGDVGGGGVDAAIIAALSEQLPGTAALSAGDVSVERPSDISSQILRPVIEANSQLDELAVDAEGEQRNAVDGRLNGIGLDLGKKANKAPRVDEVAGDGGKKLPADLPEKSASDAVVVSDVAAASVVAAQVLPQVQQAAVSPSGDKGVSAERGITPREPLAAAGSQGAGKGVEAAGLEPRLPPVSEAQAPVPNSGGNVQPFANLLSERIHSPAAPQPLPSLEVPQRVDSAQWGQGLGDKVVWMVGSQTQGAELKLNPPALGPLEVRVSMSDGQATLSFMTPHAPVREAIEAATTRLREMLGDSGINLGSVSVNVGTFAQQQQQQQSAAQGDASQMVRAGEWDGSGNGSGEDVSVSAMVSARYLRDGGMVDFFA